MSAGKILPCAVARDRTSGHGEGAVIRDTCMALFPPAVNPSYVVIELGALFVQIVYFAPLTLMHPKHISSNCTNYSTKSDRLK